MNFFDMRTAYLVTGLLYFIMPAAVWLALRQSRERSVNEWCAGGVLFGLGLLLLSLRQHLPSWVTYEAAALSMNLGHLSRVTALSRECKRPLNPATAIALLGLFLFLYELARWLDPQGPSFFMVAQSSLSAYFCWMALLAYRLARQEGLLSAYWLGMVYAPLSLLILVNVLRVGLGMADMNPLHADWGAIAIVLMGSVTAVIGNTCFMGIYVERALRQQLAMAKEQARADENARLTRQIAHLDRVRGMGTVTASVVHELSQPLTSIRLIAEHAQLQAVSDAQDEVPMLSHMENILRQSTYAAEILQRVRTFVAPKETPHMPVSLQSVAEKVLALLHDDLRTENIMLQIQGQQDPVMVLGDPIQLAQILVNLCRNSIQASMGQLQRHLTLNIERQGNRALLQVRDNGPGFSKEALAQVHKGFFSTKADGLGLGLLVSRQIASQHQGRLDIRNLPEGGAIVELDLPVLLS